MKKILCAAALAAMVAPLSTAQAKITLYEKDGLKYSFGVDWQIQLRQAVGADKDVDIDYDDMEMKHGLSFDLANGLTAFGEADFDIKNGFNSGGEPNSEEAYLGIKGSNFSFLFGSTDGAADNFGVADNIEGGGMADDVFDQLGTTGGDDLIMVTGTIADMITVAVDYEISADSSASSSNGEFYTIFASADVAGFNIGAAYQNYTASSDADTTIELANGNEILVVGAGEDCDMYGVSLSYDAGVVYVGADYSTFDGNLDNTGFNEANVVVSVPLDAVTLTGGWQFASFDAEEDDINGWYVHVRYTFPQQKAVSIFAEVADNDVDGSDMGYVAGMRLKF